MDLNALLDTMVARGGSDLHLKAGAPPRARIHGEIVDLASQALVGEQMMAVVNVLLNEQQKKRLVSHCDIDVLYRTPRGRRFRTNVFRQEGTFAIVMRHIPLKIPSIAELGLPPVLEKVAMEPRGLVLVTGTTGSGKSTTLAAMIDMINTRRAANVITIEDPVEFFHTDKKSLVSQRSIGHDVPSFVHALKYVLRQDPDVILIGEMRDKETIEAAITAAETGHLVFSTLHTTDAPQTIERILNVYTPEQQEQVARQLSLNLKAVISQRLLRRADGQGRVAALEIMLDTPLIRKLMLEREVKKIYAAIKEGRDEGMQTFNQVLVDLFSGGVITKDEALVAASRPEEFELVCRTEGIG